MATPQEIQEKYQPLIRAAERKEQDSRNFWFFGLTYFLTDTIQIRAMRAVDWVLLYEIKSPFVCGGWILPQDIAQFIWLLHPLNTNKPGFRQRWNKRRVFKIVNNAHQAGLIESIREYLDLINLDAPGSRGVARGPAMASFLALCQDTLAREYGWSAKDIAELPLPQVFQFFRLIRRRNDPESTVYNRLSGRVKSEMLHEINELNQQPTGEN